MDVGGLGERRILCLRFLCSLLPHPGEIFVHSDRSGPVGWRVGDGASEEGFGGGK